MVWVHCVHCLQWTPFSHFSRCSLVTIGSMCSMCSIPLICWINILINSWFTVLLDYLLLVSITPIIIYGIKRSSHRDEADIISSKGNLFSQWDSWNLLAIIVEMWHVLVFILLALNNIQRSFRPTMVNLSGVAYCINFTFISYMILIKILRSLKFKKRYIGKYIT